MFCDKHYHLCLSSVLKYFGYFEAIVGEILTIILLKSFMCSSLVHTV